MGSSELNTISCCFKGMEADKVATHIYSTNTTMIKVGVCSEVGIVLKGSGDYQLITTFKSLVITTKVTIVSSVYHQGRLPFHWVTVLAFVKTNTTVTVKQRLSLYNCWVIYLYLSLIKNDSDKTLLFLKL